MSQLGNIISARREGGLWRGGGGGGGGELWSPWYSLTCQEGVATLQKDLPAITLPEFSGSYRVKMIGNVNYRFYSLNIRRFELLHSTIEPMPGQGLRVSVSNALAEMTGRWELKKRWLKDDGSFELKVDGISISVGLKLGSDDTGRPTVTTLDCNTHISNVDIDISGKWDSLTSFPCCLSLPVTANIDHTSSIDYSLIGPPVATSQCVDLDLKGEFFSTAHRSPVPFPAPPLSFPLDPNRMVQFGISTYFFNTAGDVYYKSGSLTFWIVDEMVPQEVKIRLNTSSFQPFIPQVSASPWEAQLKVSPSSVPSLSISPEALSLTPSVDIQAFAILPDSSLAPLFVIEAVSDLSGPCWSSRPAPHPSRRPYVPFLTDGSPISSWKPPGMKLPQLPKSTSVPWVDCSHCQKVSPYFQVESLLVQIPSIIPCLAFGGFRK
uniref:Bactericidal permeability-increasing protein n=1 Tax=Pseudonaja textilis TaxID=8673 RepID=A0A670ZSM2_PSETE